MFVANLLAMFVAWIDGSWGAAAIGVIWGPSLNVGLVLLSLVLIPKWKRSHPDDPLRWHVAISFLAAVLAVFATFGAIAQMDLHGC